MDQETRLNASCATFLARLNLSHTSEHAWRAVKAAAAIPLYLLIIFLSFCLSFLPSSEMVSQIQFQFLAAEFTVKHNGFNAFDAGNDGEISCDEKV